LAVEPSPHDRDAIFSIADNSNATDDTDEAAAEHTTPRRTITMYRNGFQVDDGPYRRLDDPENADFLRSLAMGRTPRELVTEHDQQEEGHHNVTVNLLDKRTEEYVETFRSFSGTGTSLGTSSSSTTDNNTIGVFEPSSSSSSVLLPSTTTTQVVDTSRPFTSIQVKLLNGTKQVVKINLQSTVGTLASMLNADEPFRLVTGFPPQPLVNPDATIEESGLKGAQVMMKKA
jgi:UBX domain-containing protein 1